MRIITIGILAWMALCGCNNNHSTMSGDHGGPSTSKDSVTQTESKESEATKDVESKYWQKLEMVSMRDAQGNLISQVPVPSDWKMVAVHQQGEPSIIGPYGLKVVDYQLRSYMYTNDPRLQQSYYQSGMKLRPWPGVEQVIEQDIKPQGEQMGLKFIKSYEIPEVTKADKWYNDQLYKAVPTQSDMIAMGTEWQMADGTPFFLLVHINVSQSATMQSWGYYSSGLTAEPGYFDRARKQLIFSLANTRYALEPIMAYNQSEAQKAGQSWAAFNQRMAQNQAAFEAQQRAHINKSEAINDAIMTGWKERNASSDHQQEQFVDAIREETKVQNIETGQNYKVASHHNQYWMNNDGDYIGVNLNNYNPNLDENMNSVKWQELRNADYK